ncbi:hypothetical protein NMY22_g3233 [Coprinellus aureogranulatus]|nr:hypothetical protein NMY22_g3233 [Coprinellus aureogranulatus]
MAYAYDLTWAGNVIARSMLAYMAIGLVVLDLSFFFRIAFAATSPVEFLRLRQSTYDWSSLASQCMNNVVNFIGDGLLLYRCYIIWSDMRWVVVVPAMAYVTSIVFGILYVLPMVDDISTGDTNLTYMSLFIILSVVLNMLVTFLISARLLLARRRLRAMFPDANSSKQYTGVVAILIESAIPVSLFGLGLAIILGISRDRDPHIVEKEAANYVFSALYFSFAALSPQMIIFRVTTGRSWVGNFNKETARAGSGSNGIIFARTTGGDTYDLATSTNKYGQSDVSEEETKISEKA